MKETIIVENPNGVPSIAIDETTPISNSTPDVEQPIVQIHFGLETISVDQDTFEKLKVFDSEARVIRCLCLIEFINSFINFSAQNEVLILFSGVLSYIGYLGASEYNEMYVRIYLIYNYLSLLAKISIVTVTFNTLSSIIIILFVGSIIQAFITFFIQRFFFLLINIKRLVQ